MAIEFEFKNYRVFKDYQILKLRNLNIIIGKNNSGKSAVLKLPKLFADVIQNNDGPLILNSNGFVFAVEFKDFIYGKANRSFDLNVRSSESPTNNLRLSIIVENQEGKYLPIIEKWSFNNINLEYDGGSNIYNYKDSKVECNFEGYNLTGTAYEKIKEYDDYFNDLDLAMDNPPSFIFSYRTSYIGPIREKIERFFDITDMKISNTYSDTFSYIEVLVNDFKSIEKNIFSKVSDWYTKNFDGWELTVDLDKEPIYSLYLRKDGVKINILDTGIGINQVLPILVKAAISDDNFEIISIEEPEAHLNPAVHGNLLEEIVNSALLNPNKYYILETHSENFVLRLRRLIAEKKIDTNFCSIYNVDFDANSTSSSLTEIELLENGEVDFWPTDIFNDTFDEVVAIRSAQN